MPEKNKVLLLDDDEDLLALFRDVLSRLSSQPEIHTTTSGARALALLASEPFSLLISDLRMPRMDGLQVLTIVRRKFPQLRTAVMSGLMDEQFRTRAYAVGVDLFLEKPRNAQELNFFIQCIESLLEREACGGFRGVQHKSMVDLIQLECLSQSSSILKISRSGVEGKIWIKDGEIIDATAPELAGEAAFQEILSWKTGNFEILPPDLNRPRTIFGSTHGLLLETAQAFDEAQAQELNRKDGQLQDGIRESSRLAGFSKEGIEYIIVAPRNQKSKAEIWGVENPEAMTEWTRHTITQFRDLGADLKFGELKQWSGRGPQRRITLASGLDDDFCVAFHAAATPEFIRERTTTLVSKCLS
jgi:CheY-like chemotaxis protein